MIRSLIAISALALAALMLTGCGESGPESDYDGPDRQPPEQKASAPGADFDPDEDLKSVGGRGGGGDDN